MVNKISDEVIESLRQANDVVDIVGEYVQLKKQGRNYFGLCPFHSENTPSFSVNQEKQIYHCFGCGKGGNVISFIMEMEGYTFQQAIQFLADKSGQVLPEWNQTEKTESQSEEQKVLEAHNWLVKLYHHLLRHSKDGKEALDYLYGRGFTDETIDTFQLGFAPVSRDFVVQFLEKKGFHKQVMANGGVLAMTEDGHYYDRFQSRIIFPIRNHLGKTVAFNGRTMSDQGPKYMNSPETPLFTKSKLLYNFDLARGEIRKRGEAVLFEGAADVIAAYQAGVKNGVASLGTSLTETHVNLLRRYVDTVVICYDGDNAGQEATDKAISLLKKAGCTIKVGMMPNKYDPDQYIREYGAEQFSSQVIASAEPEIVFLLNFLRKNFNLNLEGDRLKYVEVAVAEIAKLSSSIEQDHYIRELAGEFKLSIETLKQEILARKQQVQKNIDNNRVIGHTNVGKQKQISFKQPYTLQPAYYNAERRLIAVMLQNAFITEKVKESIGSKFNLEQHQVLVTHLYGYYEEGNEPDPAKFLTHLNDRDLQQLVVELSMFEFTWEMSDKELSDCIRIIEAEQTDNVKLKQLQDKMRQLERNNPKEAAKIAMEIIQIKQQSKNWG
ncbi:DNA primase [Gracilibacillus alcaliphilus]|uniref:DNA primase n=1 Tax=Gracilibacillus alcaliphilus TaxID=1401441 RepID=UPI00195D1E98|nr:DNA primase [Gracilibacillus alcaliphilus]MBM7674998.1 DNA primase [Gracilibacillus alcaliphilus]